MKAITVGIQLGELFSRIGVFKDGKVLAVPNRMGDTSTPSIVQILDDKIIVGEQTLLNKADPKHTITNIKSLIGKTYNDIKAMEGINYDIEDKEGKIKIKVKRKGKDELFSVPEIIALIFRNLVENVIYFMDIKIKKDSNEVPNYFDYIKAVIAVPPYFGYNQRDEIKKAAELATIDLKNLINEPTAACLSFGLGNFDNLKGSLLIKDNNDVNKERKIFVFDLGGGVLDLSILVVKNNNFEVKTSIEETSIKGVDFDNKLIEYFLDYLCQKNPNIKLEDIKADNKSMDRLKLKCIKTKKKLTSFEKVDVTLYDFYGGLNFTKDITQDKFNEICEDLFKKIEQGIENIFSKSECKIKKEEIDVVILVGGTSKIPKIKNIVKQKFPNKTLIVETNEEEECVVKGATWSAHKKIELKGIKILDVVPCSLGLSAYSKKEERHIMSFLIKKNTPLPAKSTKTYSKSNSKDKYFHIKVYSGENKYVRDNKLIKEFKIDISPQTSEIKIDFEVDESGILSINSEINGTHIIKKLSILKDEEKNNPSKVVVSQNNSEFIEKLEKIKKLRNQIEETNNSLKNINDNNDKIKYLNNLCKLSEELISIYEGLQKNNDSEDIYEKLFRYTKLLLYYYTKKLILLDDDDNEKDDMINKYNEIFKKWMNDNIENLLSSIQELNLKIKKPEEYARIICFCANIIYEEGNKIKNKNEKYSRYYSNKYFMKADKILKNNIDQKLKDEVISDVEEDIKDIEEKIEISLKENNAFIEAIKDEIKKKDMNYIPKQIGTGNTIIMNKLQDSRIEDLYLKLDIYQDMADSIPDNIENPEQLESKAFCLVKIMDIIFNLKNYNFHIYQNLSDKINEIYEDLKKDDEPDWYKHFTKLKEQIEAKKKEIEVKLKSSNKKKFIEEKEELYEVYNKFIKQKKQEEFIKFILDKYPLQGCDELANEVNESNWKEVYKKIYPKYHTDNCESEIYNEIYSLLSNMEQLEMNKNIK